MGYHEAGLKSDGEDARRSAREEVERRREASTILENVGVRDSQGIGAAERAAHVLGEQVCVLRQGLAARLWVRVRGTYALVSWMVGHTAGILSKYEAGVGGRTGYARESKASVGLME